MTMKVNCMLNGKQSYFNGFANTPQAKHFSTAQLASFDCGSMKEFDIILISEMHVSRLNACVISVCTFRQYTLCVFVSI